MVEIRVIFLKQRFNHISCGGRGQKTSNFRGLQKEVLQKYASNFEDSLSENRGSGPRNRGPELETGVRGSVSGGVPGIDSKGVSSGNGPRKGGLF